MPQKGLPEADEILHSPPLAPRPIAGSYVWRLLFTDGAAVTALVFVVIGLVFTFVGVVLAGGRVTALIGVPFVVIGLSFLIVGGALGVWRYGVARQVVRVLREGQATQGQVVAVTENYSVRVNQRHPWVIRYQFRLDGRAYEGRVSTLNVPGAGLHAGKRVNVLYLPDAPEHSVLYPHP